MTNDNNENKQITKKDDLELTERNWLLLKYIEKGHKVKEAYRLAGYKGNDNQAYHLYWRLKKKLEMVYTADNVDSLRLKMEAKKILDMPVEAKPIKPETRLKAIDTLSRLTESKKEERKLISPFIVFKAENGQISASQGQVIDVKEVEKEEDNEMNEGK
jgi:hypothetical protein